jgi:acetyl-CoA carboxylase beta subunit
MDHGFVDRIVQRNELRRELAQILRYARFGVPEKTAAPATSDAKHSGRPLDVAK